MREPTISQQKDRVVGQLMLRIDQLQGEVRRLQDQLAEQDARGMHLAAEVERLQAERDEYASLVVKITGPYGETMYQLSDLAKLRLLEDEG